MKKMKRRILPNYKTRLTVAAMLCFEVAAAAGIHVPERITEIGIPLLALFIWYKIDRESDSGNGKQGFLQDW